MFRVECPGCSAPYQVDERRVPDAGLKMRCPKCARSFVVSRPGESGAEEQTAQPPDLMPRVGAGTVMGVAPAEGAPPQPRKPRVAVGTIIGAAPPPVSSHASKPLLPRRPGIAMPRPSSASARPQAEPIEQQPQLDGEWDLPSVLSAQNASLQPAATAAASRKPPAMLKRPKPPLPRHDSIYDFKNLSGRVPPRPSPRQVDDGAPELDSFAPESISPENISPESVSPESISPESISPESADLPELGENHAATSAEGRGAPSLSRGTIELDLPASPPPLLELEDLPAPQEQEAALPSLSKARDRSAPPEDDGELPVLLAEDLFSNSPQAADVDLGESLPTISRADSELPEVARVDSVLPALSQRDLSLPLVLGKAPPPELPSPMIDALDLDGGAFGEVELPATGDSDLDEAGQSPPSLGVLGGALAADVGAALGRDPQPDGALEADHAFELPDLDAGALHRALGQTPGGAGESPPSDLGPMRSVTQPEAGLEHDLDFGAPPSAADPFGIRSGPSQRSGARRSGFGADPFDDHGPASSAGGPGYGEVDLGDEDLGSGIDTGDSMEFGAIPQEDGTSKSAASSGTAADASVRSASLRSPMEAPTGDGTLGRTPPTAGEAKRTFIKLLGVTLLLGVAGGALALLPRIGPFGIYYAMDLANAEQHAKLLAKVRSDVLLLRDKDEYQDALKSVEVVEQAIEQAERYRPLQAYKAFAAYSVVLRHGSNPELQSVASVMMQEFAEAGAGQGNWEYSLAQAAQAAVEGNAQASRAQLDALNATNPGALEVMSTRGEVELGAKQADAALTAWSNAVQQHASAWTVFGQARAYYRLGKLKEAAAAASKVFEFNTRHHGALLLLAQLKWAERNEAAAIKDIDAVLEESKTASKAQVILAHSLLGELHLDRGRLSKAEGEFNLALKLDPKAFRALCGLADTYYEGGRHSAALARYEAALASEPDSVRAEIGIAKSHIALERLELAHPRLKQLFEKYPNNAEIAYWYGTALAAMDQREDATKAFELSIDKGGDSAEAVNAYIALARLHSRDGKLAEAKQLLDSAEKKLPESALLKKALGDVALSQGRYEEALAAFQKAEELDPRDLTARFKVGIALRRLKRYDEAWTVFEQVAKLDKDLPGLPLERGLLLEESGKSAAALKEYEAALKAAPDDLDLMLRVGCGRVVAGDGKGAHEVLNRVFKKRPNSAEVNHCLGRATWLEKQNMLALKHLQRAVELDPKRAEYHMYVGWVANDVAQPAIADSALNAALELDKGLADAYWQRGVLRLRQGAALDAVRDLKTALALRPSRTEAHADLAQAYYQVGKENLSLVEWHRAIESDGNNPIWRFRYGRLLNAKHRNREAALQLDQAIELVGEAEPPPPWLWQAHHLAASSLPPGPAANAHWKKFLELGPEDSPYRSDAERALGRRQ